MRRALFQKFLRHFQGMQAIGRLRPLTNPATIYVATNEPLPETLDITGVYAGELFDGMASTTRRSDFQDRVRQYAEILETLVSRGIEPTNRAICKQMGIKECNGFRYRKLVTDTMARAPP